VLVVEFVCVCFGRAPVQAECYHYLFEAALKMHQMGLNPCDPLHEPLTAAGQLGLAAPTEKKRKLMNGNGTHAAYPVSACLSTCAFWCQVSCWRPTACLPD